VLIHTSFLGLKSDKKYQILTKYAKRMCVFVFVYVQVRICEKWTKTKPKPTKTSTRMEKGQKPEPGKLNYQRKLKMSKEVLKDSYIYKKGP
jgi:hypothetical protein